LLDGNPSETRQTRQVMGLKETVRKGLKGVKQDMSCGQIETGHKLDKQDIYELSEGKRIDGRRE